MKNKEIGIIFLKIKLFKEGVQIHKEKKINSFMILKKRMIINKLIIPKKKSYSLWFIQRLFVSPIYLDEDS